MGITNLSELLVIPVFKVPNTILPDTDLLTTWKNEQAEGDVSICIGIMLPFYSTGTIQRKNLYKESCIARYEDIQALQPEYLGRIRVSGIRELN